MRPADLLLYLRTLRRLHPSQVAARVYLLARQATWHRWAWFLKWRYGVAAGQASPALQPLLPYDRPLMRQVAAATRHQAEALARLADLQANRFSFLTREVDFGERISWNPPGEARLWRYNLHYFDYFRDLIVADALLADGQSYHCFRRLVDDWIAQNPMARGVGWHAYPLALRLVNWLFCALACQRQMDQDEPFRLRFLASLYGQCRFLADHLEWDCRGNHLLEDGKSLLTAGLFFQGEEAARWFRLGARIVWQALQEQILPDGGHYERSPMYHAIVLQDYLEIFALYSSRGLRLPEGAEARLRSMVDFFVKLRHPDGDVPLLGDTALGVAPPLEDLLPVAAVILREPRYKWPGHSFSPLGVFLLGAEGFEAYADLPSQAPGAFGGTARFPDSGYLVMGDGQGNALVLDAGEIGPEEVPAHGHCNMFGYELTVNGRRLVVDSGVETYEPGPWRDYYRSTRAHNTLMVSRLEQSETWAAFRVARRARIRERKWGINPELAWCAGTHDGFARGLPGLQCRRLVVQIPGRLWLISDRLWGTPEKLQVESFIHFHPEVKLKFRGEPWETSVALSHGEDNQVLQLIAFGFGEMRLTQGELNPMQGWYAPRFGLRFANPTLILKADNQSPHLCGYVYLLPDQGLPEIQVQCRETEESYTVSRGKHQVNIIYTPEKGAIVAKGGL